ncbi:MAG: thioredoxin family protein [Flavobacteriaceae bacterium]|uniref:thioredoxin family protein n=1 Tax=Maribacter dokdonensis TaxID=320912 RepID=UPI003282872D
MKPLFYLVFYLFLGGLNAQWHESFEEVVQIASEEDKPIILVFSGSDWCAPCIKLKRKIWESEEFKTYAVSHYVLYNADFPRKKKNRLPMNQMNQNKSLAEKYNIQGHFPLVVILDQQESVLGKVGFDTKATPKTYISMLNSFIK